MKEVVVIGAGFSGMTAAYFLNKAGYKVVVFEKRESSGGLIKTIETPWGQCELAANGILNSKLIEDLAQNIGLTLVSAQRKSCKRYIFRDRPCRWPLSVIETFKSLFKFIFSSRFPKEQETVLGWGKRVLGSTATQYLLAPALQGIYAGDISEMSASLILHRFFKKEKRNKPRVRGLVSPAGGMGEFFVKTETFLKSKGVQFFYDKNVSLNQFKKGKICVLATSVDAAAEILEPLNLKISRALKSVEMLSLIKVTSFYKDQVKKIKGFGILFPRGEGFSALGILFNNFIFNRGPRNFLSESFIYGGATDKNIINYSDSELLKTIKEDRARLYGREYQTEGYHIQRWVSSLPNYTVTLEHTLKEVASEIKDLEKDGIFISGNFLGGIGLSHILESSSKLPAKISSLHG